MPKMSEGNMQEQAALDSIKEMRKKKPKAKAKAKPAPMMEDEGNMQEDATLQSAMSAKGFKKGGMCRGGGKATRGLKFSGVK